MKTFTGTPVATLVNANGIAFNMRLVRKGDSYGRAFCLTHDEDKPMVEFYDSRYIFEGEQGAEFGQFVSRYYAETLQKRPCHNTGLNLEGSVKDWTVDDAAMTLAHAIIEHWLS